MPRYTDQLNTESATPDAPTTLQARWRPFRAKYTAPMPVDLFAEVIANTPLSSDYNVIALAAPTIAAAAGPGQFVMVKTGSGYDPLLRRPYSIFETVRDAQGVAVGIAILSKRIGRSTALLYESRVGDRIACLGPLGRPWPIADPPATALMVAGGVGLAAFVTLAEALRDRGVAMTLFYGARSAAELLYLDLFDRLGVELVLTTEDGSRGERGLITGPLERRLAASVESPLDDPTRRVIYACGPERMMAAVAKLAIRYQTRCLVSMERVMGCGMGGCYSCVVPVRSGTGFHHVRTCIDGPVMPADQIVWD